MRPGLAADRAAACSRMRRLCASSRACSSARFRASSTRFRSASRSSGEVSRDLLVGILDGIPQLTRDQRVIVRGIGSQETINHIRRHLPPDFIFLIEHDDGNGRHTTSHPSRRLPCRVLCYFDRQRGHSATGRRDRERTKRVNRRHHRNSTSGTCGDGRLAPASVPQLSRE